MSRLFIFILYVLIFIVPITRANNNNTNWQLDYMEHNLAKCFSQLIVDEKISRITNIRISVNTELGLARYISGDIIDQIRATETKAFVAFEILPTSAMKFYEIHTRLIIVDSYESFRDLLERQRKNSYDIHGERQYYYILLTNYQEGTNTVDKILDLCLKNYIVNVNLIVEDSKGIDTIYTYFPFTETSCRKSTPTIYNRFAEGKFQWIRPVFPRKLKNLWLCPVRAVTWHKPPFVFLDDQKDVSGIDGNFLVFLSKAMNFTLDVFKSPQGLGEVLPNGTTRGAFKIMQNNEADLMVGGIVCTKPRRKHLACTRNYFTTSLQIVVKKPTSYSSLEILLFPFDSHTWYMLLIFYFINLTVRGSLRKIGNKLNSSGILSKRLQTISWLLSIFIIRISYEGSIFKFMHNQPIRRAPQNFEEALAEGYKFIVKSSYLPLIKHIQDLVDHLILSEALMAELFDEFDKFKGKYALINLDNYLTVIANDSTRFGQYVEVREPIIHNIVCVYLPKFSFLTEELNRQIEMMINYGHMQKVYEISVTDKLRKITSFSGDGAHPIQFDEINGAFEMLLLFIGVGFLFLLMEILAIKCVIIKQILDFLH